MKKRNLTDIVTTIGVGVTATVGGIKIIERGIDIGDRIAPHIEKYAGLIGSGAVEYGLPVILGLGTLSFIYTATKATDRYLLEQKG